MKFLSHIAFLYLLLAWSLVCKGQLKTFVFSDELCEYRGYYSEQNYNEEQLLNTWELFKYGYYISDEGIIEEMSLRFEERIRQITDNKIVESRYFKLLKDSILYYLKETYKLKIAEKNAKINPKALIDLVEEGTKAHIYALALNAGGNVLLKAYEGLVIEQMKNSSIPEERWRTYQNEMQSIDRASIAFKNVLIYGWWNNANHDLPHLNHDNRSFKEFMQLFEKVDTVFCDEP